MSTLGDLSNSVQAVFIEPQTAAGMLLTLGLNILLSLCVPVEADCFFWVSTSQSCLITIV